jgi:ribosomal-protein-serine acetyltransferase
MRIRDTGSVERLPDLLHSPRLTLRRWVEADGPALSAAILDSLDHLHPWMPWVASEPVELDDRVALIDRWNADWEHGGDLVVGIFLNGTVVGGTGLHRRRGPGVLEIGYWVHVDYVREGIASEASEILTTAAFTVPDIERVEIHHDKINLASSGIPRRLGFTFVDETPNAVLAPGEAGIDCRWLITRDDWCKRQRQPALGS